MEQTAERGRLRFGPMLAATVFTVLLLWITGEVMGVFLLLFLGILISLYLGALTGVIHRHTRIPERIAFLLALLITFGGHGTLAVGARPATDRADAGAREGPAELHRRVGSRDRQDGGEGPRAAIGL